jgi:hypothetical protein
MNTNQIKKAIALKNWVRFAGEIFAYVISVLDSIVGRSTMQILLAMANGYVGSLAFADLYYTRFMRAVMASDPALTKQMAEHIAHSQAHWAGIVIMLFLDACIFMFGFMKEAKYSEGGRNITVNLERWSKYMAVLSCVLGAVGFVEVLLVDPVATWGATQILQIVFGFIFSSIAPILMFHLTRYMRAVDGELVTLITDWVRNAIKKNLTDEVGASTLPRPQRPKPSERVPFDIHNLDDILKN